MPVFAFQTSQVAEGAAVVLARDYFETGHLTAAMAARIMRGENPAKMPFQSVNRTKLIVNLPAARALNQTIVQSVIQKATEVIR